MAALLEVDGYTLRSERGFAVRLPALQLRPGAVAALYGPSGGGKTSVLEGLLGLLDRDGFSSGGAVRFDGRELGAVPAGDLQALRRRRMAFLMQDAHATLDPLVRVGDQIAAATDATAEQVHEALRRLGVGDADELCRRQPHRISGGQAQRVLLAIAFLRRPALVVADEPTASLDGGSYGELRDRLRELVAAGSALLLATHDERLLRDLDADVYALRDGAFVRGAPDAPAWPAPSADDVGGVAEPHVLEARAVTVRFGARAVLDDVDLVVRRGEVVALLGESGAGKTTLLRVLAGRRAPDRGDVVRPRRRTAVQLVGQDAFASLTPGRTLTSLLGEAHADGFEAASAAAAVHLDPAVLARTAVAMSGGERRRAALLRALAVQPEVLLLDEPTASLDRRAAVAVVDNLLALRRDRGLALVLATHDEDLAAAVAHRSLRLRGGRLCEP